WSIFLWVPAVRNLWWGGLTVFAGAAVGALVWQAILGRRVRRWTREILIPESQQSGIDLRRFISLVEDLPAPGPHNVDDLRRLKEQEETIRDELKKLRQTD